MAHGFDEQYWQQHWQQVPGEARAAGSTTEPNPHLVREVRGLPPGTALDAGCGDGGEAIWLASHGWQVTAADISADALSRAAARAAQDRLPAQVRWLRADLTVWAPDAPFDLVTTHYAHPSTPHVAFYDRLAGWVAPGGTLLVVGHLHTAAHGHAHPHGHGHGHGSPAEAAVTVADVTAVLGPDRWHVVTGEARTRTTAGHGGPGAQVQDVVVRAVRRP